MVESSFDILISGAGIAGLTLTLALCLHRRGYAPLFSRSGKCDNLVFMIPFEDLVAALERYKQRKQAAAGAAPAAPVGKQVSGKQKAQDPSLVGLNADELLSAD